MGFSKSSVLHLPVPLVPTHQVTRCEGGKKWTKCVLTGADAESRIGAGPSSWQPWPSDQGTSQAELLMAWISKNKQSNKQNTWAWWKSSGPWLLFCHPNDFSVLSSPGEPNTVSGKLQPLDAVNDAHSRTVMLSMACTQERRHQNRGRGQLLFI